MYLFIPRTSVMKIVVMLSSVLLLMRGATSYAANYSGDLSGPAGDSIVIHKKFKSRSHRITLYPDATQTVVFFSVRGEQGKVYHLYLFNSEGRLVKQTEIRNRQTTFIKDIEKGVYLFDVFCDDDRIGNGQIAVISGGSGQLSGVAADKL